MQKALKKKKDIKAIILAAGYATRLYPLTLNIPKPLLHVTPQKTVIDFIVAELEKIDAVDEIIVVTNHKFARDFKEWAKKCRARLPIVVLDDGTHSNEDRLGAVGDIYFAVKKRKIDSDFFVFAGDNLFDRGVGSFFEFACARRPFASIGLFDIKSRKDACRFGVVTLDRKSAITGFQEKPERPKSTMVATCLYFLPKETLRLLKAYIGDPTTSKDAPGNYIRWLLGKGKVYGFILKKGHWFDIGHFDSYKEVVAEFAGSNEAAA